MVIFYKIRNIAIKGRGAVKKFQFEGKGNVSGNRIRELRLKARLSQAALAAKMQTEGVIAEQDVVSQIESGSRLVTDYEILVLTRIFNVSAGLLTVCVIMS